MKKIYIFSVKFPFVKVSEPFLYDELPYLARRFSQVKIVPLKYESESPLEVPENCEYTIPLFKRNIDIILKGLYNRQLSNILIREFFQNHVYSSLKKLKVWTIGYLTMNAILNSKTIKNIRRELHEDDVCYFYWGKWSNCLTYAWKGKAIFVSRFHGFGDLWEENYNGYVPLRKRIIESLDGCYSISKEGQSYLNKKYSISNVRFSPLGAFDMGDSEKSSDGVIRVLSCSTLWPLKRVPMIFKSLEQIEGYKIEWTHIGGNGNALDELSNMIEKNKNSNLSVNLLGFVPHVQVLEYYKSHKVDIFINLSTVEGVPVSIMEAISFNVPVIATNVGATKDIVNSQTGILISSNPTLEEISKSIIYLYNHRDTLNPKKYFELYYNADVNYKKFAEEIYQIRK